MSSPKLTDYRALALRAALGATLALSGAAASGQAPEPNYSFSATPVYHFDSDLDGGGDAGFGGILLTLGRNWALDERASLGFRLDFAYEDWRFDQPGAFGGPDPWRNFYRYGIALPYTFITANRLIWNVTPTVAYAGESGASSSDAIEYGAALSVARRFSADLTLGIGVGVFAKIEDTAAFPFLIVDWRIDERWRLSNPAPAGPAGPAGLELAYALGGDWDIGGGVAYRIERHRLDRNGPFPDGVGEHRYIPVYGRIGWNLAPASSLHLYAGLETGSRLRVEDSTGVRLVGEKMDSGVVLGLSWRGRF